MSGFRIPIDSRKIACEQLSKYVGNDTFNKADRDSIYASIEGNIGAGKTHLTEKLGEAIPSEFNERCIAIKEKVNLEWLNAFIDDETGYAGLFQIKRLFATINEVKQMGTETEIRKQYGERVHCIGDRLPLGNFAFALVHHSCGNIDDTLFNLYGTALADGGPYVYPDVILLLVNPEKALERIKERDREGESSYTLEYLEKLDEATIFTLLYIWASGIVNVFPVVWDNFGTAEDILGVLKKPQGGTSIESSLFIHCVRKEIKNGLLHMSYERMKEIVYRLAEIYSS